MNRLIRGILYIVAGCAGIGCAALILGLAFGRGNIDLKDYRGLNFVENTAYNIVTRIENKLANWLGRNDVSEDVLEEVSFVPAAEGVGNAETDAETDVVIGALREDDSSMTGLLSVSAYQVKQLDIELAHGYLVISQTDSNQVWVGADRGIEDVSATCKGEKIVVRDNRKGSERREDVGIYIELPERGSQWLENVTMQVDAGYVEIDDRLLAEHIQLNVDAGEIYAGRLEATDFSLSVGAGSVEIDEGIFSGKVKLDCGVGEIALSDISMYEDADISCGMGTIDLELADDVKHANYVLNCGLGTIEIDDETYSSLTHEKRIDNDAERTFTLNCGMGTISIE